jgi:hypothetical protein
MEVNLNLFGFHQWILDSLIAFFDIHHSWFIVYGFLYTNFWSMNQYSKIYQLRTNYYQTGYFLHLPLFAILCFLHKYISRVKFKIFITQDHLCYFSLLSLLYSKLFFLLVILTISTSFLWIFENFYLVHESGLLL